MYSCAETYACNSFLSSQSLLKPRNTDSTILKYLYLMITKILSVKE